MRTPITLTILCALALPAALAPSTATAMDDNGGAGECRSVLWAPPGAGWNGTEFCTLTDGSAGGGGGAGGSSGDGSGSGGGTVGEVIVIVDPYSPPKSTNPLCPSRHLCLPGQSGGGRPLGYADDGRNPREPRGRGSGPAPKKPEAPKKENPKKKACANIKKNLDAVDWQSALSAWKNIINIKLPAEDEAYPIVKSWYVRAKTLIGLWNANKCGPPIPLNVSGDGASA
jgi:hypothetical protein